MALCPAHDDRDPSLSVKEGDDGCVLINCFTGCAFQNVIAALDLEAKNFFADARGRGRGSVPPYNGATVQRPSQKPHETAGNTVAGVDATLDNGATPPGRYEYPHLRLVGGQAAQDCTLDAYAKYVGLSADFLRS